MNFSIAAALDLIRNASDEQLQPYLPNITYTIQRLQKLPINTYQHYPPLSENERGHHNLPYTPPGSEDAQPSPESEDAQPSPESEDAQPSPGNEDVVQPFLGNEDDVVQPSPGSVQPSPGNEDVVRPSPESEDVQPSLGSVQPSLGNEVTSLPPLSSGCMNLLNVLSTNLPKIKTFVNTSVGKDPKVIVGKPKWLNEHPLIKDLIAADGNSSDNAIFRKLLSQWTLADSFEKWQLESTGTSRIESLVESRAASVKGVSHITLFARSIGCRDVTKAASAIGHGIKLHVMQRLGGAGLLVLLAFTHDACRRLNLLDIDNFLMALRHPSYFMIFKIAQRCSAWMGQCQELYSGQMLSLGLTHLSTTNPPQPSPKKRISSPCKRPRVEVAEPGDSTSAHNHRRADLTTSHPPQLLITASTNSMQTCHGTSSLRFIEQHPQVSKPAGESLTPRLGQERLSQDFPTTFNTRGNLAQRYLNINSTACSNGTPGGSSSMDVSGNSEQISYNEAQRVYGDQIDGNTPPAIRNSEQMSYNEAQWMYGDQIGGNTLLEIGNSEQMSYDEAQWVYGDQIGGNTLPAISDSEQMSYGAAQWVYNESLNNAVAMSSAHGC